MTFSAGAGEAFSTAADEVRVEAGRLRRRGNDGRTNWRHFGDGAKLEETQKLSLLTEAVVRLLGIAGLWLERG